MRKPGLIRLISIHNMNLTFLAFIQTARIKAELILVNDRPEFFSDKLRMD